ncbi:LrgB family protein [Anaerosporobacter faecicola]|uniref:LrgB family protein n=1 Tax=Anaerosporobacter faecicola TaxID=2718714 RepID=UPI001439ABAD|nr:LrgB family protein [Anaerosporobacter faecicola]
MNSILNSPFFGLTLSFGVYWLCKKINEKTNLALLNPLLWTTIIIIAVLAIFRIPLESYNLGGDFITMFLAPATTVLAYSIYRQITVLKKNFIPIAAGCLVGSVTSMGSTYLLCKAFDLESTITASMIPKSVTTPIAMEVSSSLSGIPSITVAAVVVTGIFGSMACPILIKLFRVKSKIAAGVGIGTCSHAAGTSKAIEIGEVEGAMSGIAIGVAGIMTVLLSLFL